MPEGSFTLGYFWQDRPYNVYHWLDPDERTLAYYANIADRTAITATTIAWRDLVVDVLIRPNGSVEVLDEDELPADLPPPVARRIDHARAALVAGAAALAAEIEHALPSLARRPSGSASLPQAVLTRIVRQHGEELMHRDHSQWAYCRVVSQHEKIVITGDEVFDLATLLRAASTCRSSGSRTSTPSRVTEWPPSMHPARSLQ